MSKRVLGLDLGTTSIGWAAITEADNDTEQSAIEKIGVRVNPLTTDEQTNFEKGKPITVNADRTLKRSMRRNLQRYKLRRDQLMKVLREIKFIEDAGAIAESGKHTTHSTYALRAKAPEERLEKEELARVFFAINKKRGYKSSRKAKNEEEGYAIDGMAIAKRLYEENLTPGQLVFQLLTEGKRTLPDFYRSDLQAEFDKVWSYQKHFYPDIFTDSFYKELQGKGQRATSASFWGRYKFNIAEIKDLDDRLKSENTIKLNLRDKKKYQAYHWRSQAVSEQLEKEQAAFVITEINNDLNNSSGYLGAISDRSKELYFNKETVGQNLYKQIQRNPHTRLKNQVFYRQDYLDEFEAIWKEQSRHHPELTNELKEEIRDITIFYQRKLRSQKGLVSFCEFERKEVEINGKKKVIGSKVAPKSSPLFQEFKIWQVLHNLKFVNKTTGEVQVFKEDDFGKTKKDLFNELNIKGKLSEAAILSFLDYSKEWELINFKEVEGNRTNQALYNAYLKIIENEGYDQDLLKLSGKDDINVSSLKTAASEIKKMIQSIFSVLGIDAEILEFNAELEGAAFEQQKSYQLWHLLYSYESDDSPTGNEKLYALLEQKFGFKKEHGKILANVILPNDYGNLSAKAMRKIYPYLKELQYDKACAEAGYRHSAASLTEEEIANRPLKYKLELLKKNSLRNPVVEKILNQMVNVVNALLDKNRETDPNFRFDEIRIELARELKKNAAERAEMTSNINKATLENNTIREAIKNDFPHVPNPTKNDIVRYKLYQELAFNGYKDLYSNTKIDYYKLFGKEYDIDHIIPQSRLFDDSFSNKVLVPRQANLDKGNSTAFDYMATKSAGEFEQYQSVVESLFKEGKISKAKFNKLLKKENEIGDGFIERDLRDSQYIAKKAKNMLYDITRSVVSTSGSITDRLREDWGLINIMKELNLPKYRALGLTKLEDRKFGQKVEVIEDWTKRNDHRHHAMDALTVAFTKRSYIQYLNYLNARKNEKHKLHGNIIAIEIKETEVKLDDNGDKKRVFKLPIQNFREQAKQHLESVLVSYKAKNKVVTKNKNKIKTKKGEYVKIELTPRGQLHKETVYGKYHYYESKEEKVGVSFDSEKIQMVANPLFKKLLADRLQKNSNDPKKAFGGKNALSNNPIYLDTEQTKTLPEKVKLRFLVEDYSIRKDITPENFKDVKTIEKVLDVKIKEILLDRLKLYENDPKKAFSGIDKNPIWLNEAKGISIKRVTISGVKNAEPLHYQKDHKGDFILDGNRKKIPVDFVSTGNNHHVAIYRDEDGNLQERVVSLFEAVQLVNAGLPVIDKEFNKGIGWQFLFTMKQNEYFVFPNDPIGFNPNEIDLLDPKNNKLISPNLFRVQTLSVVKYGNNTVRDFKFRHHLEAILNDKKELQGITFQQLKSLPPLESVVKVRINHIGQIVKVGEY